MKDDVKRFLESSLLEEYVLGIIDPDRIPQVEGYIQDSPEVKSVYDKLQENIELLAKKAAIPPPPGVRENILKEIDQMDNSTKTSVNYQKWWALAASLAAVVFCIWSFSLNNQRANLQGEISKLKTDYTMLQDQCEERKSLFAQEQERWMLMTDPKTDKHLLNGNQKAPELEIAAYWNEEVEASYLRIISLPELPEGKCLQLWADVDGVMVNVDILPDEADQIVSIPFKKDATSLNVTIEPEGGSDHPTVADLVANIYI